MQRRLALAQRSGVADQTADLLSPERIELLQEPLLDQELVKRPTSPSDSTFRRQSLGVEGLHRQRRTVGL
eukprot:5675361-Heterocapsa_arctica.AAC.1